MPEGPLVHLTLDEVAALEKSLVGKLIRAWGHNDAGPEYDSDSLVGIVTDVRPSRATEDGICPWAVISLEDRGGNEAIFDSDLRKWEVYRAQ